MKIFITGGTGLIGRQLIPELVQRGDEVIVISRKPPENPLPGVRFVTGNPTQAGPWTSELETVDAVVHLAGKPILGRWTTSFQKEVRDSRVLSTQVIAEKLAEFPKRADGSPKIFLSGSAIGYYGYSDEEELTEDTPLGTGFLPDVCRDWEAAAEPAKQAGVRVVHPRVGVVLTPEGGALKPMLLPFKLFIGGPLASGRQWMSWIHMSDMTGLLKFALDNPNLSGPLNCTAPEPQKNWGFCRTLADVLHRPSWLRVPGFVLKILFGSASELIIKGQKVIPRRAMQAGYSFAFTDLRKALENLLQK